MAFGVNARTAFSLLFPAIIAEFQANRGVIAGIFSFGLVISAVVTPFVGRVMDLRGPKIVVELGVLAMGAGLTGESRHSHLAALPHVGCTCRWWRQLPRLCSAVDLSDELVCPPPRPCAQHCLLGSRNRVDHAAVLAGLADPHGGMASSVHSIRNSVARRPGTAQPVAQVASPGHGPPSGRADGRPHTLPSRRECRGPRLGGG
jgi:hypothetical protein